MKLFYSIGEVAEMLDIPTSTVRFWEKSFDILRPRKNSAGHRKFTQADLENLKVIYHLVREKGMTLEGARQRLRENPAGISHDQEVMDRLLRVRSLLVEIRQELEGEENGATVITNGNEEFHDQGDSSTSAESSASNKDASLFIADDITQNTGACSGECEHAGPRDDEASTCGHTPTIVEQTLFPF